MQFQKVHLDTVDSTNRWLWQNGSGMMVVVADYQTAGRGQGSHSWESAQGQNLLFSVMVHPVWLKPSCQFLLSEVWALALRDVLSVNADGIGTFSVKWPNDIYWEDRKISGTLIETRLSAGVLKDVVIGTGINVNQEEFFSDAPNPVSLFQILGKRCPVSLDAMLDQILRKFSEYYCQLEAGDSPTIERHYHQSLYRRDGYYWYEDANGRFEAEVVGVAPSGVLTLRDRQDNVRHYEQREVRFVL